MDPSADLERMERKIRGSEAQAAAQIEMHDTSFDAQFRELDYDESVEDELAALKASMNPSALPESSESTTGSETSS